MSLAKKVCGQKKRYKPLEDGAAPKSESGSKPAEQQVPAFVHNQIRQIDEEKISVPGEGVNQEPRIAEDPGRSGVTRNRLPVALR